MHNDLIKGEVLAAVQAGMLVGDIKRPDGGYPFAVVPDSAALASLEEFEAAPYRVRQNFVALDAEGFIDYFNLFRNDNSLIYGDQINRQFVAIIDHHEPAEGAPKPKWGEHQARFTCPASEEWKVWEANNGKRMNQADFAAFLENNLPDIIEPDGATMLQIATTLEAKKNVNFASGIRLDNGQTQFVYEEEIQGSASKGTLAIPQIFKIGIKAFNGGSGYSIECRLRYRISSGQLSMWFEIVRPHKIIEDAFNETFTKIQEATGTKILKGRI